jgi:hypothetical protein
LNAAAESEEKLVRYQHSLDLEGCVPKHHREMPKASRIRYTGAILSDANIREGNSPDDKKKLCIFY